MNSRAVASVVRENLRIAYRHRVGGRGASHVTVTILPDQADVALTVARAFGEANVDGRPDAIVLRHTDVSAIAQPVVALVTAGEPVRQVTEVEPTLEDVSLALQQRSSGA